jgi:hypothetical protein
MSTLSVIPPNQSGRILFLSRLAPEWPELQQNLLETVWPVYRLCKPLIEANPEYDSTVWMRLIRRYGIPSVSRRTPNPQWFAGFGYFLRPFELTSWSRLQASRRFASLRRAVTNWAQSSGRGIHDEWLVSAGLQSLNRLPPLLDSPIEQFYWESAGQHDHNWPVFSPNLKDRRGHGQPCWVHSSAGGPAMQAAVEAYHGTWDRFATEMRNQFERELSKYRKVIMTRSISKGNAAAYANWTVARMAGLSWPQIAKRYGLGRYSEGETQAKKRVREFASEIGLTLGESLGTRNQKRSKTGHLRP